MFSLNLVGLLIITLIVTVILTFVCYDEFDSLIGNILFHLLGTITIELVIGIILLITVSAFSDECKTEEYDVTLYGLSNGSNTTGDFVIGCGTIKDVQYIFYNASTGHGSLKTYKTEMDKCEFIVDSKTYLHVVKHIRKIPWYAKWFLKGDTFENNEERDYVFHLKKDEMNFKNYYDVSNY